MPEPKTKKFLTPIDADKRLGNELIIEGNKLVHFSVTLECEIDGTWYQAVRYDTSGGTAHRDRLRPDGTHLTHRERVRLGSTLDDALITVRRDLTDNCVHYVREFHKLLP